MEIITDYIINPKTLAVVSYVDAQNQTKVIEEDGELYMSRKPLKLIDESCMEYASTYQGRRDAVVRQLQYSRKVPILIDPRDNMYVFPTHAPESFECIWVVYNQVKRIAVLNQKPVIVFKNGLILEAGVSLYTLNQQMQRTAICMHRF